jgi:hypothetical protein
VFLASRLVQKRVSTATPIRQSSGKKRWPQEGDLQVHEAASQSVPQATSHQGWKVPKPWDLGRYGGVGRDEKMDTSAPFFSTDKKSTYLIVTTTTILNIAEMRDVQAMDVESVEESGSHLSKGKAQRWEAHRPAHHNRLEILQEQRQAPH